MRNKESKYFYTIVFITFSLAGIIIWQLFFTNYEEKLDINSEFNKPSVVNFVFLDSARFQNFNFFKKGDDPMIPWKINTDKNPFRAPEIPQNQELFEWWKTFNIKLEIEEEWSGLYPDSIKNKSQPELILFENRGYEITIINPEEKECRFEIKNNKKEVIFSQSIQNKKEKVKFVAQKEMETYQCGGHEGAINIIQK